MVKKAKLKDKGKEKTSLKCGSNTHKNLKKSTKNIKNIIKEPSEISKSDNDKESNCFICYCSYDKTAKKEHKLRCGHSICFECYIKWSKIKDTCPKCRKVMYLNPADDPNFNEILKNLYEKSSLYFDKGY